MTVRMKKPGARIAGEDEVLECLTSVLRGKDDEEGKASTRDKLRAAELLAKRYGALDKTGAQGDVPRIIDDIPKAKDD
jgi:hypothetical protein